MRRLLNVQFGASLTSHRSLHDTNVVGSIPDTFGRLLSLQDLCVVAHLAAWSLLTWESRWLFDTGLSGNIPDSLGNLTDLQVLYVLLCTLRACAALTGGLIQEFVQHVGGWNHSGKPREHVQSSGHVRFDAVRLRTVALMGARCVLRYLFNSDLSGTIPESLGNLTNLQLLYADLWSVRGRLLSRLLQISAYKQLERDHPRESRQPGVVDGAVRRRACRAESRVSRSSA